MAFTRNELLGFLTDLIETSDRGDKGLAVNIQDQTSPALDLFFLETLNTTTVAVDTVVGSYDFTATAGHGIVVDNIVELADEISFIQARVGAVNGDVITIDEPINHAYIAGSSLIVSSRNLRVDGSSTPRIFAIRPSQGQKGDITRIMIGIQSTSNMDFSTFGSIPTLTRGCLLRIKKSNGDYVNLFDWKNNGGFAIRSFDSDFQSKIGGGLFSFIARTTYAGQDKRGVAIRLDGGDGITPGNELQLLVQDDLTAAELTEFVAVAQGHELEGN